MNNCIFVGKVYKKPEMKETNSGTKFCRFMLVVDRTTDGVDFIPVTLWRDLAEKACKELSNGDTVLINASYRSNSFEKNGEKKYIHEFIGKSMNQLVKTGQASTTVDPGVSYGEELDLPF